MTVLDELQPMLRELTFMIRREVPNIPDPPVRGAPAYLYSFWFSEVNFHLQTAADPSRQIPSGILQNVAILARSFEAMLGVTAFPMPAQLTFSGLGFWMLMAAFATSGDVWCVWPQHGQNARRMQILRYRNPELVMECSTGHKTEYEVEASTKNLKKI